MNTRVHHLVRPETNPSVWNRWQHVSNTPGVCPAVGPSHGRLTGTCEEPKAGKRRVKVLVVGVTDDKARSGDARGHAPAWLEAMSRTLGPYKLIGSTLGSYPVLGLLTGAFLVLVRTLNQA